MGKQVVRILAAGLSGLLLSFSHPGLSLWPLAWVALVPLLISLWQCTGKRSAFGMGWITGIVFYATSITWIQNVVREYSSMPGIVPFLLMLLLAAYMACFYGLFAIAVQHAVQRKIKLIWLYLAVVFVLVEWLQSWLLGGFPWNLLGYSQLPALPVIQVADLGGVYAISLLVIIGNLLIFSLWQERARLVHHLRSPQVLGLVSLIILSIIYGFVQLNIPYLGEQRFTATVLQDQYDNKGRWQVRNRDPFALFNYYEEEMLKAVEAGSDVVLIGEGAFSAVDMIRENGPAAWSSNDFREVMLFSRVKDYQFWLLMGSTDYVDEGNLIYNTAVTIGPDHKSVVDGRYAKTHLTPFGEYVPFGFLFSWLDRIVPEIYDFSAGTELQTLPLLDKSVGVPICFEVIFPDLVRQLTARGATVLATISNDAWFGRSAANQQHFNMAAMRAVENRRYLMRSAVSGISGFVDPHGRILQQAPEYENASLTEEVGMLEGVTIYATMGDSFVLLCILLVISHHLPVGWLTRSMTREAAGERSTTN